MKNIKKKTRKKVLPKIQLFKGPSKKKRPMFISRSNKKRSELIPSALFSFSRRLEKENTRKNTIRKANEISPRINQISTP